MTKYLVEGETLSDIADAIREQTGEAGQIQLKEFANKVASISGGKHTYSTTEQEVGEWIDGSTVYERTIYIQTISIRDGSGGTPSQTVEQNFVGNNIISVSGYNIANSGTLYTIPDGRFRVILDFNKNLNIVAINGGSWDGSAYIIIRYTKTAAANLTRSQEPEEEKEETTSTEEKEGGEEK